MIRKKVGLLTDVENITYKSSLIGDNPDIEIELTYPDEGVLKVISNELKTKLTELERSELHRCKSRIPEQT